MTFTGPAGQTVEIVKDGQRLVVLFPGLSEEGIQKMMEEVPTRIWWQLEWTRRSIPVRDLRRWCAAAEYLGRDRDAEGLWDEAVAGTI